MFCYIISVVCLLSFFVFILGDFRILSVVVCRKAFHLNKEELEKSMLWSVKRRVSKNVCRKHYCSLVQWVFEGDEEPSRIHLAGSFERVKCLETSFLSNACAWYTSTLKTSSADPNWNLDVDCLHNGFCWCDLSTGIKKCSSHRTTFFLSEQEVKSTRGDVWSDSIINTIDPSPCVACSFKCRLRLEWSCLLMIFLFCYDARKLIYK